MTPLATLRAIASRCPGVEEGIACKGTALESTTFKVRGKAFLFVAPTVARLKLEGSLAEAVKLSTKEPGRYKVGANGWVAVTFSQEDVPLLESLEQWIDESYQVLGAKLRKATKPAKARKKTKAAPARSRRRSARGAR